MPDSVEAGHQDAAVAQINLPGIGPGLVPVVGEPGGLIPEVRWFVIRHPLLDRSLRRVDRLEGVDVERWARRRRDVDDPLPKPPEAEEEFNLLGPPHAADGLHGRAAARAEGGIGTPDLEDEVPPQRSHGAGGAEWRGGHD